MRAPWLGGRKGAGRRRLIGNGRLVTADQLIEDGIVIIEGDQIVYAGPVAGVPAGAAAGAAELDAGGGYICPGFIDGHVHGGGGGDVMDAAPEALERMARAHAAHGTTGFVATTMSAPHEHLLAVARAVRPLVGARWGGARLLGLHLEGPYLNPARRGAHPAVHLRPPDAAELAELYGVLGPALRIVTLAPELPGADAAIRWLVQRGVVVSLGHTAASYEQAVAAIAAGARAATHAFNAMEGLHHRAPGCLGAVLVDGRVRAELIADGVHVHPGAMRLLYRCKGAAGIQLVTDAMRAVGCPPGEYTLGDVPVVVGDGQVRLRDDPAALAGSVLTMAQAVRVMVRRVGVPLVEAVRMASLTPAEALGLSGRFGRLAPGCAADVVILDNDLGVKMTLVAGEVVFPA
ncbi:MAG TPA: N-acetylglucosamine-6-phosphate deacetylase [Limnochordales bacterium]|nr:N-acetylglucosamine-6-phosphate deacetylase [Limnochordales bacterium]